MGRQVCAPWAESSELCCEGDQSIDDCVDGEVDLTFIWSDDDLILAVSNLLYARTCYRYPGECTATVWPCIDHCYGCDYQRPCVPCTSASTVRLPTDYPVISIDSITEDGVQLDAADYRLERGNLVVRLDGLRWQRNSFGIPGASGVETIIEYTTGVAPPIELRMAAAALACELKKSCEGRTCELPARVKGYARRGVEVDLVDLTSLLKDGSTGIPIVDHALLVHGRCGQTTMHDPVRYYAGTPVPAVPGP